MVISPFAKHNFIDHTLTDQTSMLRFIEDNWLGGALVQPGGSFDIIAGSSNHVRLPRGVGCLKNGDLRMLVLTGGRDSPPRS